MNDAYLRKYFIMGSQDCPINRKPEVILQEAIKGGITTFQFREKGTNALKGDEKIALGKKLRHICRVHDIPFFINDDIDLIDILDVDGIHVGQDDVSPAIIRQRYPHLTIGLSISNVTELNKSPLEQIDYIGAGAIFTTSTKNDATQAVGLQWIETLKNEHPSMPIVGIGGITTENAQQVFQAGASGVAIISAITKAPNIQQAVTLL